MGTNDATKWLDCSMPTVVGKVDLHFVQHLVRLFFKMVLMIPNSSCRSSKKEGTMCTRMPNILACMLFNELPLRKYVKPFKVASQAKFGTSTVFVMEVLQVALRDVPLAHHLAVLFIDVFNLRRRRLSLGQ